MQSQPSPDAPFQPLSISALNKKIKILLEATQGQLMVEGEVSNLARPRSGHLYFSLKDDKCQVQCVWLRYQHNPCARTVQEGMQLLVRAKVTLYEARGNYQLLIQHAEEAGTGALQRAYEALKHRLQQQGWFDAQRKRAIPRYPHTIGLITSPTGAAVQDMLSVLKRRYPCAKILIYPCQVQGDQAAPTIIQAIQQANIHGYCSVLLLARGGGNIEDLWAFNREDVAEAILASTCPIITGIGHEIDTTIADDVADLRAPTPSAAAEAATPERDALLQHLDQASYLLQRIMTRQVHQAEQQLQVLSAKCVHPQSACRLARQQLKPLWQRLLRCQQHILHQRQQRYLQWQHRLTSQHPRHRLQTHRTQLATHTKQCRQSMLHCLEKANMAVAQHAKALEVMSPLNTLSRGYTIVRDPQTLQPIPDAQQLQVSQSICVQFAAHRLYADITTIQTHSYLDDDLQT